MTNKTENPSRIIEIAGKRWLAGMYWHSFESKPTKAQAKEEASYLSNDTAAIGYLDGEPFNLIASRADADAIQSGFAQHSGGKLGKVYSLAAAVADSKRQPWLGTFRIDDNLWWYIAVRDGQSILPDGDVIGDEEQIFAARERHSGFDDWNYVDGDLDDLIELVSKVKPIRVIDTSAAPEFMVPAIALGVAVAIALGSYAAWSHYESAQKMKAQEMALAKMRAAMMNKKEVKLIPNPLLSIPMPNEVATACKDVVNSVPVSSGGWVISSITCTQTGATVIRSRSAIGTAQSAPSDGVLQASGDKLQQFIPFHLKMTAPINSLPMDEARAAIFSAFQKVNVQASIAVAPLPPMLPGASAPNPQQKPVPKAIFSAKIPFSPTDLNWNSLPGFRLTGLSTSGLVWDITGVIYGKE